MIEVITRNSGNIHIHDSKIGTLNAEESLIENPVTKIVIETLKDQL